jgi:hypothetical protein
LVVAVKKKGGANPKPRQIAKRHKAAKTVAAVYADKGFLGWTLAVWRKTKLNATIHVTANLAKVAGGLPSEKATCRGAFVRLDPAITTAYRSIANDMLTTACRCCV